MQKMLATDVPMPELMRGLPKAPNGLPIPYIVMRDDEGRPQFVVNDIEKQVECLKRKLCPICGTKLKKELWFLGGPISAFHEYGSYFDTAMHHECMTYALIVCPYLATSTYRSTTDVRMPHLNKKFGGSLVDVTMNPDKPAVFVAVMAYGQSLNRQDHAYHVRPLRPYHAVEFWRLGERMSFEEGLEEVGSNDHLTMSDIRAALRLIIEGRSKVS